MPTKQYTHDATLVGGAIAVSPGSEAVDTATSPEAAARNVEQFVKDLASRSKRLAEDPPVSATWEPIIESQLDPESTEAKLLMGGTRYTSDGSHDGRYPFRLTIYGTHHVLEMPGIDLASVRYLQYKYQKIWDFPRVFLNGSSWVWFFALGVLREGAAAPEFQSYGP